MRKCSLQVKAWSSMPDNFHTDDRNRQNAMFGALVSAVTCAGLNLPPAAK